MATHAVSRSSSERRGTLLALVAATVIGVVCAFGPIWMVRAGVLVSLLGAGIAVYYAFREISRLEALHRTELKAVRDQATLVARAHHEEAMGLIEVFAARSRAHGEQLEALRRELADRQQELSTLRGNVVSVRAESDRRADRIAELELELVALEESLAAEEAASEQTEDEALVTLPRRVVAAKVADRGLPTAAELWSDGNHPTVVDLALLNLPLVEERKHA